MKNGQNRFLASNPWGDFFSCTEKIDFTKIFFENFEKKFFFYFLVLKAFIYVFEYFLSSKMEKMKFNSPRPGQTGPKGRKAKSNKTDCAWAKPARRAGRPSQTKRPGPGPSFYSPMYILPFLSFSLFFFFLFSAFLYMNIHFARMTSCNHPPRGEPICLQVVSASLFVTVDSAST